MCEGQKKRKKEVEGKQNDPIYCNEKERIKMLSIDLLRKI
jgi:hypothetical protein